MSGLKTDKNSMEKKLRSEAIYIFGQVTGWIVAPIIIALIVGKYLDNKYNSQPWFFLGLTALAFFITSLSIIRIALRYIKKIEEENKHKDNERK
jgi:F0F1-type ATP synthase assembly protein I